MLCVLVYGTINRALMWTVGCAICTGQAKFKLLLNEINVGSALGLLVAFSSDLTGGALDLLALLHSKGNWIDLIGTFGKLADLANPLLLLTAGASLAKGPKSEDLDQTSIWASTVARLVLCVPICMIALQLTGVATATSGSMKTLGFILLLESCMPAASQLALVAQVPGTGNTALQNMSTLLFYHSVVCPLTCTVVLALALNMFATNLGGAA